MIGMKPNPPVVLITWWDGLRRQAGNRSSPAGSLPRFHSCSKCSQSAMCRLERSEWPVLLGIVSFSTCLLLSRLGVLAE
jgi:hypothetical protein